MSRLLLLEQQPAAAPSQVGSGAVSPAVRPPGGAASITPDERRRLLSGLYFQLERQTNGLAMPLDERAIRDTEILIEQVKALP